jgi:hypothetical protein
MTIASTFDVKYPEENVTLTFDFSPALAALGGGVLSSITSVLVSLLGADGNLGTDPAPAALLNGAASLGSVSGAPANTAVLQPVKGGKPGVSYVFSVVAVTSIAGATPLELKGILPVVAV